MALHIAVSTASLALDSDDGQVLRAGLEHLQGGAEVFPQTRVVRILVGGMGLVSAEGTLVQTGAHLRHTSSTAMLKGMPCVGSLKAYEFITVLSLRCLKPLQSTLFFWSRGSGPSRFCSWRPTRQVANACLWPTCNCLSQ